MPTTPAVTDFGQYAQLRALAREHSPEGLRKTAQQFEAMFTQMLLKSMRAASLGEDVLGGKQTEFYRDMFDQQLAVHMSTGKGLGLADMLVRQLKLSGTLEQPEAAVPPMPVRAPAALRPDPAASGADDVRPASRTVPEALPQQAAEAGKPLWQVSSPEEFVQYLLPQAEAAAQALGVPARVLVAQAALESGWGRQLMRDAHGTPSFNFFGIKADKQWQGAQVRHATLEYENGQMQREQAEFRTYGSPAEAFGDYVRFLKGNPRYAEALRHDGDEQRFAEGLQKAGYATDPAYAEKLLRIAGGSTMALALKAAGGASG